MSGLVYYDMRYGIAQARLPCAFTFKTYSISNGYKITCFGACKECSANIRVCINWPTDKIAACVCNMSGFSKDDHSSSSKKIKLSPPTRKELCRELEHETAIVVHKKMADKIMNTGDPEPSHMPTVGCLRQIKHEFNSSEHYHQIPILSLLMMTQVSPYKEIIRHSFFLLNWLPAQEAHNLNTKNLTELLLASTRPGVLLKSYAQPINCPLPSIFFYIPESCMTTITAEAYLLHR